jgi:hypothetical protein
MIRPRVRVAASGRRLTLNTCGIGERQALNLQNRVDKLERQAGGERLTVSCQPFSKEALPEMTTRDCGFSLRRISAPVFRFAVGLDNLSNAFQFFTHAADGTMANLQRLRDLPVTFLRRVFQLFGDDRFAGRSLPSLPVVDFNWTICPVPSSSSRTSTCGNSARHAHARVASTDRTFKMLNRFSILKFTHYLIAANYAPDPYEAIQPSTTFATWPAALNLTGAG